MREIKFRAWDKKRKEMFLSTGETEHLGSWFDSHLSGAMADAKNIDIMQYTGLYDKSGKEIYEGDIVTVDEYYFYDPTGIIKWCKDTARFIIDFDNECIIWDFDDTYSYELEVVGNIHENPELLENGE